MDDDDCGFHINGKQQNHLMITDPGVEIELNISLSSSTCQLRILAVGGGELKRRFFEDFGEGAL